MLSIWPALTDNRCLSFELIKNAILIASRGLLDWDRKDEAEDDQ